MKLIKKIMILAVCAAVLVPGVLLAKGYKSSAKMCGVCVVKHLSDLNDSQKNTYETSLATLEEKKESLMDKMKGIKKKIKKLKLKSEADYDQLIALKKSKHDLKAQKLKAKVAFNKSVIAVLNAEQKATYFKKMNLLFKKQKKAWFKKMKYKKKGCCS